MELVMIFGVLLLALFVCIVNSIFRKLEYKNRSEWKKYSIFNSPTAWEIYSFFIILTILGVFLLSYTNIITGFSSADKQQNTITKQQQNMTTQQQDDNSNQ